MDFAIFCICEPVGWLILKKKCTDYVSYPIFWMTFKKKRSLRFRFRHKPRPDGLVDSLPVLYSYVGSLNSSKPFDDFIRFFLAPSAHFHLTNYVQNGEEALGKLQIKRWILEINSFILRKKIPRLFPLCLSRGFPLVVHFQLHRQDYRYPTALSHSIPLEPAPDGAGG